jgi:hypothetical protein
MTVVYTAIYGGYDRLQPHVDHPAIDEWVCFTDNPDLSCTGWDVRPVAMDKFHSHPRMQAKFWKCNPPPWSTQSIWIDGSMEVYDPEFYTTMLELLTESDVVMWSHPSRTSIVDEARVSEQMAKYHGLPVVQQAHHYCTEWGWADTELWASTTMGRNHTDPVLEFGLAWWHECLRWTYQDQISLPPLLERHGLAPAPLPYALWRNPWWRLHGHASDL